MKPKMTEVIVEGESINICHPEESSDQSYDGFSISYGPGGWMPGTYNSVESAIEGAKWCFTGRECELVKIIDQVNNYKLGNRSITLEDLGVR